ncbi:spore coat protein U domain-containing protein [Photobacterium sp. TY1-4]|uniref:Csu type fimbrial protein n=1 Tax=Photobacterium sp. TY1-4 TaxID=2899122 RepID=UPI0021BF7325|nr:spore coat U domain-containing protein [Photobacterium sp. TY1-4]UXI02020.1 spore coat U domain-containing protein [Photobacterium sp. TY1-4]
MRTMFLCLILLQLSFLSPVLACTLTASSPLAQFGSASSFTVKSAPQQTSAQPHAGLSCDFSKLLSVLSGDRISVTLVSAASGQLTTASDPGSVIDYQVFGNPDLTFQYILGQTYNYFETELIDVLGLWGGTAEFPLYIRTQNGSNLSAGLYTDQITVFWDWDYCSGIGVMGACLGRRSGTAQSLITLELTVTSDCVITAPDLNFGTAPLVAGFVPVNQTITLTCTKGSAYSIGLGDGAHVSGSQRRMSSGTDYLAYEIYKSAGNERWGSLGGERREHTDANNRSGLPDGLTPQGFDYRGVILSGQVTPPPGTYSDSVIVDVHF